MPFEQLLAMASPAGRQYVEDHPVPITGNFICLLMVPMHAGPATVDTLGLFDWNATEALSQADIEWVQRAADRVGLTIDSAQVRTHASDRLSRLTAVNEIALAVASAQDVRLTLKQVIDRVIAALRVDAADIVLVNEIDGSLSVASAAGFRSRVIPEFRFGMRPEGTRQSLLEITLAPTTAVEWETMAGQAAVAVENAEMANALHRADRRSRASGRSSRPELTDREREILRLLIGGATNREVGDQLHLSHNTIKFHIRQLLEKAGVSNRTELATKAALQGWV